MNPSFWQGKRVLMTGHTGFKGGWLSLWLQSLGAKVTGYALAPPTSPSFFELLAVGDGMESIAGDIRDCDAIEKIFTREKPEIVFHLAAQSLVRTSYGNPVETYAINVMGTVNVLEAVRNSSSVRAVVNVTSDKCYENQEFLRGYKENDPMGGHDPYSSSKGCSELVTSAYRASFFSAGRGPSPVAVATARAGNVIGGGDWAKDRIVPDIMRAIMHGEPLMMRNPGAVRPWQHVLEPLSGYMLLAEKLWDDEAAFSGSWNFGPPSTETRTVQWIAQRLAEKWGEKMHWQEDKGRHSPEAHFLALDSSKARSHLGWKSRWDTDKALDAIVDWYKSYKNGMPLRAIVMQQIKEYTAAVM